MYRLTIAFGQVAGVFFGIIFSAIALVAGFSFVKDSHAQVAGGLVISPKDKSLDPYFFMGAASCNGSNCHGSTKPRPTRPEGKFSIPQNEYWIWLDEDFHAKAYKVLTEPDSQRMAKNLGLEKAETSQRCLVCHAVDVNEEQRGINYDLTEGVTCEGCHGPAEKWLGPHTRKDWTKEKGAALGMFDTKNLEKRTERCLACHLGVGENIVDHELIGAGHPRLNFELDMFSAVMPSHWFPPKDKKARTWLGAKAWATGQAVALRKQLQLLIESRKAQTVLWPDLIHFDCYACHHDVVDRVRDISEEEKALQRWRVRDYAGKPGRLIWNASAYSIYQHLLLEIVPEKAKTLDQLVTTFHNQLTGKAKVSKNTFEQNLKNLEQMVTDLIPVVQEASFSEKTVLAIMRRISDDAKNIANAGFQSAEQAVLGLASLYESYADSVGKPKNENALNASFDALYEHIKSGRQFNLLQFTQDLTKFRVLLNDPLVTGAVSK